jgi:hypothetical protein
MNLNEFFRPEKRKVLAFLFIIFILVLRGLHWDGFLDGLEEIDLIWVPLLLLSTLILVPVGILFWMGSRVIPVTNDIVPFSNDLLQLIYPGLVLYSYFLACAVTYMIKVQRRIK